MWQGKKVAFIGDSITEGVGTEKTYHAYLAEWLGIIPLNYGVNGAQTNDMLGFARRLKAEHPDADAVFVFGGTNDFNSGVPMGGFFDERSETVNHNGKNVIRRHRVCSLDGDTFCGRLNLLFGEIKRGFPDATVFAMTPIHRGYAVFGEDNVQPDELWANEQGLFIDDYVRAVRQAAELWSMPLIDLYRESGLLPALSEYAGFFHDPRTDLLHPNARGHERIARTIRAVLDALPD